MNDNNMTGGRGYHGGKPVAFGGDVTISVGPQQDDDDEDDGPDPTHECMNCRSYRTKIEQPAGLHEKYWCDTCDDIKQFERIQNNSRSQ